MKFLSVLPSTPFSLKLQFSVQPDEFGDMLVTLELSVNQLSLFY